MNALAPFTLTLCAVGVSVSMASVLIPQKRTKRTLGFVLGLFVLVSVIGAVRSVIDDIHIDTSMISSEGLPTYSEDEYNAEAARRTADILVTAVDDLLREDGITADDIRITVRISDEGRIYADRIVVYIDEQYRDRKQDISEIIERNLSKEPDIYVKGQKAERADNG